MNCSTRALRCLVWCLNFLPSWCCCLLQFTGRFQSLYLDIWGWIHSVSPVSLASAFISVHFSQLTLQTNHLLISGTFLVSFSTSIVSFSHWNSLWGHQLPSWIVIIPNNLSEMVLTFPSHFSVYVFMHMVHATVMIALFLASWLGVCALHELL